jgi:aerobic-type carbon monoxide dehydrogenase small subunit (CoxS/CutS family)
MEVRVKVNGFSHVRDVPAERTLAELLREDIGLTGTKVACAEGTCGSCTVMIGDHAVLSCLTLAVAVDGASVRTVEGEGELLERLREAFTQTDGFQCGFCTPGQLMSALALLERNPSPRRDEIVAAMSGNLCRCGAYEGIRDAVERAAGAA